MVVLFVFCCSVDCVKWGLLPQVTEEMELNCSFVKGRFTGDPSYEYEHTENKRNPYTDPDQEEENTVSLHKFFTVLLVVVLKNYKASKCDRI